ncbi:hypothetical protein CHLRE_06g276001v5 [Chlamydomonas reinhardtii]|uniref:Uncharacterized protein n=1 Tax=Chlamydomonas reinhardtii TaxID=3055 RepID=A8HV84_CHLRE|nr:uncharacterized protein CHLRE_06g276001v5 [Chlamydomonas reinhardtii]PNW82144.1 hypothetical protein CHLRE_06g276001v5 [Chlamydomonas reinhardtii]|eukprot:XP_001696443.1 translocase of mitochondrial membrane [Chlamydomonas reinhardtii]
MASNDLLTSAQKWLREEYTNEAKFGANLRLLRGIAIFGGAVFVFRNFGEALFGA